MRYARTQDPVTSVSANEAIKVMEKYAIEVSRVNVVYFSLFINIFSYLTLGHITDGIRAFYSYKKLKN